MILSAGLVYRRYLDEGNLFGFRLQKIKPEKQYNTPSLVITPTFFISPSYISQPVTATVIPASPTLTPLQSYSIKVINSPEKVKLNYNSAFTWEIIGPSATTAFTTIVGAKESSPGHLGENETLEKTPYRIFTEEFTNGNYNIPLVFVGNAVLPEYGVWYFRALAVIKGKNIWSDEHSLRVE